jgi:hypothetical protein
VHGCLRRGIEICCNQVEARVDRSPKKNPRYKKVSKVTRALLLEMVDSGLSIVEVPLALRSQPGN